MSAEDGFFERVWGLVGQIPKGRVATYGQVAELVGIPRHARQVGYALHALEWGSSVPWHRVINARGEISMRKAPGADSVQRQLLEREGVVFNAAGRVNLATARWRPRRMTEGSLRSLQAPKARAARRSRA